MLPLIDLPIEINTSTSLQKEKLEYCVKSTSAELFEEHRRECIDLSKIFQSKSFNEGLDRYYRFNKNITWFEIEDSSLIANYELFVKLPIKNSIKIKVKVKSISKFTPKISI